MRSSRSPWCLGWRAAADFSTYWDRGRARLAGRGRYEIQFDDMMRQEGRRLRVEADGYMPAVSRVIRDDEDDPVVNFVLHKGAGVSGVVHLPDGTPLAGADVVLVVTVASGVPHQWPAADGQRSPGRQDGRRRPFHLPAAGAAVHDRRARTIGASPSRRIRDGPRPRRLT